MQLEILFTEPEQECHCTVEDGCQKPAIAALLITHPTGEPHTMRFLCLDHLNELSEQMTIAMFKASRAVLKKLEKRS